MAGSRCRLFFIVGAQKGGTTALFEYLRRHPDVHMPPEKEIAFFSNEDTDEQAWIDYRSRYLSPRNDARVAGTATPQYLCDPQAPARIAALVPDALLIAVLRDPIERAVSHYKMTRRRGRDERSFPEAVEAQLEPSELEIMRRLGVDDVRERDAYVVWGEYVRMIRRYLEHFPREQVLVLFSEDLRENRKATLRRVYEYLDIRRDFTAPNLERLYHVGGTRSRIPGLKKLLRSFPVRRTLRTVMSRRRYRSLVHALERWNVRPGTLRIPGPTYAALAAHYAPDLTELERLCGTRPRWLEHTGSPSAVL